MQRRMRRMMVMVATLAGSTAYADVHPTIAVRTGPHETNLSVTGHDDYVWGDSDGHGFAAELEGGLVIDPQWALTCFVDYAAFHARLDMEYPQPIDTHSYDASFRDVYAGARVTWRPVRRLFIGGAVGAVSMRQQNRPLDQGGVAFDSGSKTSSALELTVGTTVARTAHVRVEVSIGVAVHGGSSDNVGVYVPAFLGAAWE